MKFISALALLGILIFVHELGHFIFAKLMKVRVLKFSLGFGPRLWGRKYGDTEYVLSALPFGGYVKMLGENSGEEELKEEDRQWAFNYQPVWRRFLIVIAGPAFNIVFAAALLMSIFSVGVPMLYPHVGEVLKDSAAEKAGLMKGDKIIGLEGMEIKEWPAITGTIYKNPGKSLKFKIERDGRILDKVIIPEKKKVKNIFGEDKEIGLIGIKPSGKTFTKRYALHNALVMGVRQTAEISALTVMGIVKMIQRIVPAKTIGGPIMIMQMAGEQASAGVGSFFVFMAFISINLGIINLLPVPVLDGGHMAFLAIEAVRKKPLSEKTTMLAQRVGLALLLSLMAFALYNDILRLLTGELP